MPAAAPIVRAPRAPASRPAPAPGPALPRRWIFESPAGALSHLLQRAPRVIGIGEYHQKTGSAEVQSPLRRFTRQMLEHLADQSSDLILELAVPEEDCGGKADKVASKVEKTTERPAATENEAVTLLMRARRLGLRAHVLGLSCKDYQELLGSEEIDYQRLLTLLTEKMLEKARAALSRRVQVDSLGLLRSRILLYGGALHNDLYPAEEYRSYSYAAALQKLTGGRYLELDLYVPEYVEGDKDLGRQPFYAVFKREAGPDRVVLIERGPSSYILILQRGLRPEPAAPLP